MFYPSLSIKAKGGKYFIAFDPEEFIGRVDFDIKDSKGKLILAAGKRLTAKKAKMLKEDYLTETGQWFNGYSVIEVNQKYCFLNDQKTVDVNWSINIIQIAEQLKKTANKQ